MSAAKAAPPLTLATARIVHAQGEPGEETTRVFSGESVARALHVTSQHADNLDEIEVGLQAIAALELAEAPLAETHARFTAC